MCIRDSKRAYKNYVLEVDGVQVDVECHVGPPHVCSLKIEDMLARSTRSNLLGFPANVPDFTDHVVLQIVNVFKDKIVLAGDGAVGDLDRAAGCPEFEPSAIAQRLDACDVATIGWLVCGHVSSARWSEVRDVLSPVHRSLFARAFEQATSHPNALST